MASANTAPLSGMRDFLPAEVLRRRHAVATIERVYQSFGFEPLETPTMERLETLLGKYGEEGDQLIFRVLKRGEALQKAQRDGAGENALSDGGLRYDLTVPLARVVAAYRNQLPRVFKRYQIQPVYRADRPAKGRFREFYQCDVDIVGSRSLTAEAEVIGAVAMALVELGFGGAADFVVRLNHRGVLRGLMQVAEVPEALEASALVAIDKLDKIGIEGVREELARRGIAPESARRLLGHLAETPPEPADRLDWLSSVLASSEPGAAGADDLRRLVEQTSRGSAASLVRVDPYLARGLSYYTGAIFEVAFPDLGVSAGGGGRYDGLVGMFSGQQIPACGFSLGLERILLLMEERGLFPEQIGGSPQVLITQSGEERAAAAQALARRLRASGLRVDLYLDQDRYGPQFQYAEKRGIRYAALTGAREIDAGMVVIRDLVSGDQVEVPDAEVTAWLLARI